MTGMSAGKTIYNLRKRIKEIQNELDEFNKPAYSMQELINSTNLLRSNEQLSKINDKQNELLSAYAQHSKVMEELLASVFEIQMDLKEILKEQSSLISNPPKTDSKSKPKKK